MDITVASPQLRQALATVRPAIAKNGHLPILHNVQLVARDSALDVIANNMDLTIRARIPATIHQPGTAIVAPNALAGSGSLTLSTTQTGVLLLTTPTGSTTTPVANPDDWPPIPCLTPTGSAVTTFGDALRRVLPAVCHDELRPMLTGVNLKITPETLTLAACDGFRLAVETIPVEAATFPEGHPGAEFTVPWYAMHAISKLTGTVSLVWDLNRLVACCDNVRVNVALIQGTFPNYPQLIPVPSNNDYPLRPVTLDTKAYRAALDHLASLAKESSGIIRHQFVKDSLTLSANADEQHAEITLPYTGEHTAKTAINFRYLKDLTAVAGESMDWYVPTSVSSPVLIRLNTTHQHVIMPMFVQW